MTDDIEVEGPPKDGAGLKDLLGPRIEAPQAGLNGLPHGVGQRNLVESGEILRQLTRLQKHAKGLQEEEGVAAGSPVESAGEGDSARTGTDQMAHNLEDGRGLEPGQSELGQNAYAKEVATQVVQRFLLRGAVGPQDQNGTSLPSVLVFTVSGHTSGQAEEPIEGGAVGPVEVVEAEENGAGRSDQPEHQATERLPEARASLIRLDRKRWGKARIKVAQLGEDSRGLGQPDGLDTGCKPMPVGDGAEELGNRLVRKGMLPGSGGRDQDEGSIA
jgi:hypothetical protein